MITVTDTLADAIIDNSQYVTASITARFADNRYNDNIVWSSSSEFFENQILRNSPFVYWRFDDLVFAPTKTGDLSGNGIYGTLTDVAYAESAIQRIYKPMELVSDSFNRANSTDGLGALSSNSKYVWNTDPFTIWGIDTNEAYIVDKDNSSNADDLSFAWIDTNGPDGYIECTIGSGTIPDGFGLVCRYIDRNNYIAWKYTPGVGTHSIRQVVDGTGTTLDFALGTFTNGDVVKFEFVNQEVKIYKNGTLTTVDTVITDDQFLTATNHGMFIEAGVATSVDARWNSIEIDTYDVIDYAGTFNGTSSVVTSTTLPTTIPYTDDITVGMWIKPTDISAQYYYASEWDGIATPTFAILNDGSKLSFFLTDDLGNTNQYDTSPGALQLNEWSFFVATKKDNFVTLYVNGSSVGSYYANYSILNDGTEIAVGANPVGSNYSYGYIDEFFVLKSGLTDRQVEMMYKCGLNTGTFIGAGKHFTADQAINGFTEESISWAVLDGLDEYENCIVSNGTYKVLNSTVAANSEYGWWSRSKSAATLFTDDEIAWFEFDERKGNKLIVSTGYLYGRLQDINYYYRSAGVITSGTASFAEGESIVEIDLGADYDIDGFGIEMVSTWNDSDYGRIFEADLVYDVDITDYIVSFNFTKSRENYDSTLPIGLTASNTLNITLDNTELTFNAFGTNTLAPYIADGTEFFVTLAWQTDAGEESIKVVDSMYADSWDISSSGMTVSVDCRDWSKFIQETTNDIGFMMTNSTVGRAVDKAMKSAGFPARKIIYYDTYYHSLVTDRPMALWRMSDTDGATVSDEGGNFDGTATDISFITQGVQSIVPQYQNAPAYTIDRNNTSISDPDRLPFYSTSFDGTADGSYEIPTTAELDIEGDFTIECVVKFGMTPGVSDPYSFIIGKLSDGAVDGYGITMHYVSADDNRLEFIVGTTGDGGYILNKVYTDAEVLAQPTVHIVARKNGSDVELWVDGVLEDSGILTDPVVDTTTNSLGIGAVYTSLGAAYAWVGTLGPITMWNRPLTDAEIARHYTSYMLEKIYVFNYLFFIDSTPWDGMLEFATADVGIFYLDEDGYFNYEYGNTFHETVFDRHRTSQYTITDEEHIKDGSYNVEVQANRVIVTVNPLITLNTGYDSVWRAQGGESLAVTTLTADCAIDALSIDVTDTENPLWLTAGYLKIDDEIIGYSGKTLTSLTGLTRGLFGTKAATHSNGALVRETRHYEIEYSSKPVVAVKYPFLTAKEFDMQADIDKFVTTPFKAEVIVSANETNAEGDLVILEGKNPVTDIENFFAIAGIPLEPKKSDEKVVKEVREISAGIKRSRPKEITIDNQFIQDKAYASLLAEFILKYFGVKVPIITVEVTGIPQLQLGDLITIEKFEKLGIYNVDWWVIESSMNFDGGLSQTLTLRQYTEGL